MKRGESCGEPHFTDFLALPQAVQLRFGNHVITYLTVNTSAVFDTDTFHRHAWYSLDEARYSYTVYDSTLQDGTPIFSPSVPLLIRVYSICTGISFPAHGMASVHYNDHKAATVYAYTYHVSTLSASPLPIPDVLCPLALMANYS